MVEDNNCSLIKILMKEVLKTDSNKVQVFSNGQMARSMKVSSRME